MVLVVVATSLFLTLAVKPGRLVPTRSQSMAEMSYEFVADMIHSATGTDGLKFFPFILHPVHVRAGLELHGNAALPPSR